MKTLNESINEVMNNGKSISSKRNELVKLGLRPNDVSFIMYSYRQSHPEVFVPRVRDVFEYKWGVELETYNVDRRVLEQIIRQRGINIEYQGYNHVDSNTVYKMVSDCSISGVNPIECVSPVLNGNRDGFASVKGITALLNEVGAKVNKSTGFHVHISAAGMNGEWFANVFKNYQRLECLIDTFMPQSRRANVNCYCRSMQNLDLRNCHSVEDVRYAMSYNRYFKVNCEAYDRHRTIEFRQHSGTVDYSKIENWVKFCAALVGWSKDNVLDRDLTSIDEIPFLSKAQKDFYKNRQSALTRNSEAA